MENTRGSRSALREQDNSSDIPFDIDEVSSSNESENEEEEQTEVSIFENRYERQRSFSPIPNPESWPNFPARENWDWRHIRSEEDGLVVMWPAWVCIPAEEELDEATRREMILDISKRFVFEELSSLYYTIANSWKNTLLCLDTFNWEDFSRRELEAFCNRSTAFYWMKSAQADDNSPLPLEPFGCVWNEWYQSQAYSPNIDNEYFIAEPIRLLSTGPTSIPELISCHRARVDWALACKDVIHINDDRLPHGTGDGDSVWNPPDLHGIIPLFRAIVMIMDVYVPPLRVTSDGNTTIDLDEHASRQHVILARTNDDDLLSAPINFDELRDQGLCLPLGRDDVNNVNPPIDAVRVTLRTAVAFVTYLEKREEAAVPSIRPISSLGARTLKHTTRVMMHMEEVGIDGYPETWAIRRAIRAERAGIPTDTFRRARHWMIPHLNPEWRGESFGRDVDFQ